MFSKMDVFLLDLGIKHLLVEIFLVYDSVIKGKLSLFTQYTIYSKTSLNP